MLLVFQGPLRRVLSLLPPVLLLVRGLLYLRWAVATYLIMLGDKQRACIDAADRQQREHHKMAESFPEKRDFDH